MISVIGYISILGVLLAAAVPHQQGRIPVSSTSQGILIWHGHRLDSPVWFSVEYSVDADTVWEGIFINDLPMYPRRPPLTGPTMPVDPQWEARDRLGKEVGAAFHADRNSGRSDHEMLEHVRSILSNARDLVDSAKVDGELSVAAYWKGESAPFFFSFNPAGNRRIGGPPGQFMVCESMRHTLESGGLVIIGGGVVEVPPGTAAEFLADCDSLRAGKPIERSRIKDRHAAQDCAHPVSIERLLRDGE